MIDEAALPEGSNPFVSIRFDAREICTAASSSLANNLLVGRTLAEICNPVALAAVRGAADQARQLKRPVLGITISQYFSSAFSLDGFTLNKAVGTSSRLWHQL
ncbi:MAG: hypothetical protein ACK6DX_22565, partial [Acidobacteriota bacterium]